MPIRTTRPADRHPRRAGRAGRPSQRRAVALTAAAATLGSLLLGSATAAPASAAADGYRVGVGIADITGEAAEVGMMGYARLDQETSGIHSRQWARAFAVADGSGGRTVFVSTDLGMIMQGVQQDVIRRLGERYGSRYTDSNVVLSATHTHAAPGGHSHHLLYNLTILGHKKKTYEAIVSGIVRAVAAADADLAPGKVKIATGELDGANVNRSQEAFRRNPAEDRERFPDGVDRSMTVLRFEQEGQPVGMVSWFATHATSMTPENTLISPDNKGYAQYHVEHDVNGVEWGERGRFVAAFPQSNAGDMSPNLREGGAKGPTDDEFENTEIIGKLQADKAVELFNAAKEELTGPIAHRQRYVDFSGVEVGPAYTGDGRTHSTCPAALGQGFTAGAEDGPGPDIAEEGELKPNPLLTVAGAVVAPTPAAVRECQKPKPVFITTGVQKPSWTPQILPLQLVRIGQLTLTAAPAEFTVVAGHRVMDTVAEKLGPSSEHTVFAGYSNAYSGYVTTPEEYDAQHYEGASTHFGRYTLPAYQQEFAKLASSLRSGEPTPSAVRPPWLGNTQLDVKPGVVLDSPPLGKAFGDLAEQPAAGYAPGERAEAVFYTGHPRNNLRGEGTFLEVQRQTANGWRTVATDNDWSTTYRWKRSYAAVSTATTGWEIPADAAPGTYRFVHRGDTRNLLGEIDGFTGVSRTFTVG
ncbi:neutral/alkaline ceramidase [Streptomyces xinghaiensis]|uniref:neutral/alkaline ceramidase n=1 Tax=Streptomyces xinghaiensis TaxID=1038928 RepID=UPI00378A043E